MDHRAESVNAIRRGACQGRRKSPISYAIYMYTIHKVASWGHKKRGTSIPNVETTGGLGLKIVFPITRRTRRGYA